MCMSHSMLLALSDVTYVLIGWFKFLLLKFLYEYCNQYEAPKGHTCEQLPNFVQWY